MFRNEPYFAHGPTGIQNWIKLEIITAEVIRIKNSQINPREMRQISMENMHYAVPLLQANRQTSYGYVFPRCTSSTNLHEVYRGVTKSHEQVKLRSNGILRVAD